MKIIINADDLGLNDENNEAIIYCLENKFISSTSLVVNGLAVKTLSKIIKSADYPIGLHFNLTQRDTVCVSDRKYLLNLVDEKGYFKTFGGPSGLVKFFDHIPPDEVTLELKAQITLFQKIVRKMPDHVDSHHGVHAVPSVAKAIAPLIKDLKIPIRNPIIGTGDIFAKVAESLQVYQDYNIKTTDEIITTYLDEAETKKLDIEKILNRLKKFKDESIELCVHPSLTDDKSLFWRRKELEILKDSHFQKSIRGLFEVASFPEI